MHGQRLAGGPHWFLAGAFLVTVSFSIVPHAAAQYGIITPGYPLPVYAWCFDAYGAPVPNVPVYFQVVVLPYSGNHDHHDSGRPPGRMDPQYTQTDSRGRAVSTFWSTDVAGIHTVLASSPCGTDSGDIWVMWNNPYLTALPNHPDYDKVGVQPEHTSPFYGTDSVVYKLQQIAMRFRQQTGSRMCVNDMSLPWGGRFDLGPRYGGSFWFTPPHAEHQRGINVDIPFSCLGQYRDVFVDIARSYGAFPEAHPPSNPNHYHLRFGN